MIVYLKICNLVFLQEFTEFSKMILQV